MIQKQNNNQENESWSILLVQQKSNVQTMLIFFFWYQRGRTLSIRSCKQYNEPRISPQNSAVFTHTIINMIYSHYAPDLGSLRLVFYLKSNRNLKNKRFADFNGVKCSFKRVLISIKEIKKVLPTVN